jgi:hypothetical protein
MAIKAVTENEMIISVSEVPEIVATHGEGEAPEPVATLTMYQQQDLMVQSRSETLEGLFAIELEIQGRENSIEGYQDCIKLEKSKLKLLEQRRDDLLHDLQVGQQRLNLEVTIEEASDDDEIDTSELDDLDKLEDKPESDETAEETEGEDEQ